MADPAAEIEALALATMHAWLAGDAKTMKKMIGRDFVMMVGTLPPQLIDRPSFLAAMGSNFVCTKFAFREVFVRRHKSSVWMVAGCELELALGAKVWSGPFLITDLWRIGAFSGWKLMERSLARLDEGDRLADRVRALQLWK